MSEKKTKTTDMTFWIRFRSSLVLMAVTVTAIVLGGYVLWGVLLAVSLIGLMELYRALEVHKSPAAVVGYIACAVWYGVLLYLFVSMGDIPIAAVGLGMLLLTALFIIALLAVYVFAFPKFNSEQITMIFFGLFYVAITLSYIFLVRSLKGGAYSVWLIFIGSWGADTMAYMVGRKIGKHKIVPILSPKKSLEGFVGGVIGAVLISVIYALIFRAQLSDTFSKPVLAFIIIAAVSAVVSMIGDLAASAIKRDKNIKDYGKLIPGHGGILDRFDSVIFIAPIVYILLMFII